MKIAIDARNIYRTSRRGTGKNLIDLYRRVASLRPEWTFFMFYQYECLDDPFSDFSNVISRRIDIPGDRYNFWQNIRLPLAAKMCGADILHSPANTAPRYPIVPSVVTIHDLHWFDSRFQTAVSKRLANNLARAVKSAKTIITPSEFTRNQIVKVFGVSTDNIIVNHWAPESNCGRISDCTHISNVKQRYGLAPDKEYVFGFGAKDVRKNTERILCAWSELGAGLRARFSLLLVGIQEDTLKRFEAEVKQLGIEDSCHLHSFADESDLPALMSGASVLCYPSLGEGFGLPILDGFTCGTAVLTSNVSSLPEIAGNAAMLVNPENTHSIAGGLRQLLSDRALLQSFVERGNERVKDFSWGRCAETVVKVFEDSC